ncbi:hypothetical protein IFM46972_07815 [Aspergillus udagawae]|uniref:DNA2/NAM7 helicase helicase domain-containing protein n=1 Tax=Aspergillus udagawae TaxID=91492 RepID=A0A8H3RYV6_9EURO|nr:hypothetical protein IFM46972_07815 [Aspergillus udagawae]
MALHKRKGPFKEANTRLIPHDAFFIDDYDRHCRLVEASRIEKDTQYWLVANVFNPSRRHRAWYTPAKTESLRDSFFVHIKLQAVEGETEVQFEVAEEARTYVKTDLNQKGVAVETHSSGDLVLLVKSDIPQHREIEIVTFVKPNTMPIDEQIKALGEKEQYSPTELNWTLSAISTFFSTPARCPRFFHSSKPREFLISWKIPPWGYSAIMSQCLNCNAPFADDAQLIEVALHDTTTDVHLDHDPFWVEAFFHPGMSYQWPPGTGKTRTAVVIILLLMALNLKVLLVAGSNKGVDNLAEAVVAALSKHTPLQRWCGQLVRFRTPAYQLAQVRIDSANSDQRRLGASRKGSLASQVLDPAVAAVPVLQQSEAFSARRAWVALPQCASYSQAPQSLPGLSAAPPQDEEEAGHEDVEMMEDFGDQRAPSEPREYDEFALQLYRERERSHSPEHPDLSIERGYRDRRSPGRDVAMRAAYYVEGNDVQALRRQSNEMRLRSMIAQEERLRAQEEREMNVVFEMPQAL